MCPSYPFGQTSWTQRKKATTLPTNYAFKVITRKYNLGLQGKGWYTLGQIRQTSVCIHWINISTTQHAIQSYCGE